MENIIITHMLWHMDRIWVKNYISEASYLIDVIMDKTFFLWYAMREQEYKSKAWPSKVKYCTFINLQSSISTASCQPSTPFKLKFPVQLFPDKHSSISLQVIAPTHEQTIIQTHQLGGHTFLVSLWKLLSKEHFQKFLLGKEMTTHTWSTSMPSLTRIWTNGTSLVWDFE